MPEKHSGAAVQMAERSREILFAGFGTFHGLLMLLCVMDSLWGLAALHGASLTGLFLWRLQSRGQNVDYGSMLFLYGDVLVHTCAGNALAGSGSGFYLYPLFLIPCLFFMLVQRGSGLRAQLMGALLSLLAWAADIVSLAVGPGLIQLTPEKELAFLHVNMLITGVLLVFNTFAVRADTLMVQTDLTVHAGMDPLTGLNNRYGMLQQLAEARDACYSLVMCDIDNFKLVNDTYGHSTGDQVLTAIGRTLASGIRKEDAVARWGGEEFLIVLRTDADSAVNALQRIQDRVRRLRVPVENGVLGVTMTFGIADSSEADSFDDLVRRADENLMRGKRSGKDCIVTSSQAREPERLPDEAETRLDKAFLDDWMFDLFAATSDMTYIFLTNMETRVSRWSRSAVDYFGLPGEYIWDVGSIWLGFVHPEDREAYALDIEAVLSGKKRVHDISYRARNRSGQYVRLICKGVVDEGDGTRPPMFAGTITNMGLAGASDRRHLRPRN